MRGHLNGIRLAAIGVVGYDLKIELLGEIESKRITGNQSDLGAVSPCPEHFGDVLNHGLRQCEPRWLIQNGRQPLLGVFKNLYRNKNHLFSMADRACDPAEKES